jgi:hypothetical protein
MQLIRWAKTRISKSAQGMRDGSAGRWGLAVARSGPVASVTARAMSSVGRAAEAQSCALADVSDSSGMTCLRQRDAGAKTPW